MIGAQCWPDYILPIISFACPKGGMVKKITHLPRPKKVYMNLTVTYIFEYTYVRVNFVRFTRGAKFMVRLEMCK